MKPISIVRQREIANNVLAACENIHYLNQTGYGFLKKCHGFISHENIFEFKAFYEDHGSLVRELYRKEKINQTLGDWKGPSWEPYYCSRIVTYNLIMAQLRSRVDRALQQRIPTRTFQAGVHHA